MCICACSAGVNVCVRVPVLRGVKNNTVYWFISTRLAMLMTWITTHRDFAIMFLK